MNGPLDGKLALVTGGSRGLGAATAVRLAEWGARVVVTYRQRRNEAEAVAGRCEELSPGARAEHLDLLDEDSVRALFARVREQDDALDLLVANAAQTAFKPLLEVGTHHVDKTFSITVRNFLVMVQEASPLLLARGGRIVAVSGLDTVAYVPGHGVLAAAKAAMETLVGYLACELGPRGVTAIGVRPGVVDTDSTRLMAGPFYERLLAAETETHPLREAADADDAAAAVALVCLPEARWLNGHVVGTDGGGLFAMLARFAATWARVPEGSDAPPVDAPILRDAGSDPG